MNDTSTRLPPRIGIMQLSIVLLVVLIVLAIISKVSAHDLESFKTILIDRSESFWHKLTHK